MMCFYLLFMRRWGNTQSEFSFVDGILFIPGGGLQDLDTRASSLRPQAVSLRSPHTAIPLSILPAVATTFQGGEGPGPPWPQGHLLPKMPPFWLLLIPFLPSQKRKANFFPQSVSVGTFVSGVFGSPSSPLHIN